MSSYVVYLRDKCIIPYVVVEHGGMGGSAYLGKLGEQGKWINIGDSIANPILRRKILMSS